MAIFTSTFPLYYAEPSSGDPGNVFEGAAFSLYSIQQVGVASFRVTFTHDPLLESETGEHDGLNPDLYSITGPGVAVITAVNYVPNEPQQVEIFLSAPLEAGDWTLTVSDALHEVTSGAALSNPRTVNFTTEGPVDLLGIGGHNRTDDAARVIRKHLSPALVGRFWDALVDALAVGDAFNWDNARKAFDQLFKSTASGIYLVRRAGDDGVKKPANIGMSDDLFREYSIKTTNEKLTQPSFWEILEVFYGDEAVRAYIDTDTAEPYRLAEGEQILFEFDRRDQVLATFDSDSFASVGAATALELAAALTAHFDLNGSDAYAKVVADPETGLNKVRVYSGSIGLNSSVAVKAGDAQASLKFGGTLPIYADGADPLDIPWEASKPSATTTKYEVVGEPNVDLRQLRVGDYVVVTSQYLEDAEYKASFEVVEVSISHDGTDLIQSFTVSDTTTPEPSFEGLIEAFRAVPGTIYKRSGNNVSVSESKLDGSVQIVLPATTQAVNRTLQTGAYLSSPDELGVVSMTRDADGVVTVVTSEPHGLAVGAQVVVEEAYAGMEAPAVSAGAPGTSGNPGTTDANLTSLWAAVRRPDIVPTGLVQHTLTTLADGRAFLYGGVHTAGSVFSDEGAIFAIDSSATLVSGAVRHTYSWTATATDTPRRRHRAELLVNDSVLVSGGQNNATYLNSTAVYAPSTDTWSAGPNMSAARADHASVLLESGKVLLCGGQNPTVLASCDLYDPDLGTISATGAMETARYGHVAVLLEDGRVLVIGGFDTNGDPLASCEIYDPDTGTWSRTGAMSYQRHSHNAIRLPNGRILVAGGTGKLTSRAGATAAVRDVEIFEPLRGRWLPAGRLQGDHLDSGLVLMDSQVLLAGDAGRTELLDLTSMTWKIGPTFPDPQAGWKSVLLGNGTVLTIGGGSDATTGAALYVPASDTIAQGGFNGVFSVASIPTSTSFTYSTDRGYSLNANEDVRVLPAAAVESTTGTYVFDPNEGAAITSVFSTITSDLNAGQQYRSIEVADATEFPDQEGWLCVGFGTEEAVFPIPYHGRGSDTSLLIDYKFRFPKTNLSGATVSLLYQKGPYAPEAGDAPSFWLTDSAAGRLAAIDALERSASAGANLEIEVIYPGDKGLGGAGLPVSGTKISDIVEVFGGDDLDEELAEARGEE